ncbi:class I adenylate-forming enzyme family protein [Thermodesulforhabdus norvegica]|uniref:Malonyl-CoA/methylmalonyl-CoA synthetase n=1 Tax=Thermodesulforhabdus norvegica TaxID=39841 RepID=A0A1I4TRE3_9BACT|nr:AMP-binding protein [Thermodesulforhabdus norvegica]SFM79229.1 malonyl-CoA/methylmalonyl-CoA synthetase [Thermodesulforhabdus norvegica]
MNVVNLLLQHGKSNSRRVAVDFEGDLWTYGRLYEEVLKCAALLKTLGIEKGDRIALQLPKGMDFICLHLGIQFLGAVTLPLNPAYSHEEIEYFLSDSQAALYITNSEIFERTKKGLENLEHLKIMLTDDISPGGLEPIKKELSRIPKPHTEPCRVSENDISAICYTSGTTGKPKGAMISHKNLISNMLALQKIWRWTERDVLLHVLPLFHVHGLFVALHGALNSGCKTVMHARFDPVRTWEDIEKHKCTMLMAVPTIYYRLVNVKEMVQCDISSMRVFISGSAPLLENLFNRFEEITGHRILERYGMTEAQMITSNPYEPERRIPKSVGYPLPGVSLRVVDPDGKDVKPGDVGEVWIKGDNVFLGYWNNPEKTGESFHEGWFKSGDLGYQDPDDGMRLYLVGRAKELIISGGLNVYPKEVENVLEEHESVAQAAVVGLADPDLGERVVAAVVLKAGVESIDEQKLISYCRERLAPYKCPKQVFMVEDLPKNAMGKVQKSALRRILESKV